MPSVSHRQAYDGDRGAGGTELRLDSVVDRPGGRGACHGSIDPGTSLTDGHITLTTVARPP